MTSRRSVYAALLLGIVGGVCPMISSAGEIRVPVGISYTSGAEEVQDAVLARLRAEGYVISDDYVVPIGITVAPYYELDCGFGFGASAGPAAIVFVERSGFEDDTTVEYVVPIAGYVRYSLLPEHDASPYVRAGVTYNIAGGDYLSSGDAGGVVAVGIEFWRNKAVALGLEVGYSTSTVTIDPGATTIGEQEADYGKLTVTVSAVF